MKKKIYIKLGLCIILLVTSFLTFKIITKTNTSKYVKTSFENKKIGELKHYTKDSDEKFISIFYPQFEQETLNKAVISYINKETSYQTKHKYIQYSDYESEKRFDNYILIKFHQFIYNENNEILVEQIHTINYDIKADKILQINDILRKDYYNMITAIIHKERKAYLSKDISDFYINQSHIDIYFNHEEKDKIVIPYEEFSTYIKLKNKKIPSLFQKDNKITNEDNVDPLKPMIAFTFDDGPSETYTKEIMDAFDKVDGTATFFMLGSQVIKYKEIVQEVDKRGFEVANHTYNHLDLKHLNDLEAYKEIFDTQDLIYSYIGKDAKLIRPPYGSLPNIDVTQANINIALWNVDTLDCRSRNTEVIKANIMKHAQDGSIILLHDIYGASAQAITEVLPILEKQGYQFVSMSTIIKYRYS